MEISKRTGTVVLVMMLLSSCILLCLFGMFTWKFGLSSASSTDQGLGGFRSGYATYYHSYPPCCKNAPNYDSRASQDECTDYSGCKYMGEFAGVKGKLPIDQVKKRNIVAFFDDKYQRNAKQNQTWWSANVKGKKLEVRNPSTGKTMIVEALDTCGNYDCRSEGKYGCCTENALKGDGVLIDFEINTSKRFWEGAPRNGKIQWRWIGQ